jgi:hypothetical protein
MNTQSCYNRNKYNPVIHDYMFSLKNITKFTNNIVVETRQPKHNKKNNRDIIQKNTTNTFIPREEDRLFWILYVMKNDTFSYEMIENSRFKTEKELKFQYVDLIRKNKEKLKMNKIKLLSELEDDLVNKREISIKTFIGLCILEGLNVIILDGRKMFESKNNDTNVTFVIKKNLDTSKFQLELNVSNDSIQNYRNTYYILEDINNNKLKAIGSYKLEDLINICSKMNLNCEKQDGKKMLKKDIYELIVKNM